MGHPLWDADCLQCHETYAAEREDAFHAFDAHNREFPYACVECHDAHHAAGPAEFNYLERERVLPVCRDCHEEY